MKSAKTNYREPAKEEKEPRRRERVMKGEKTTIAERAKEAKETSRWERAI